MWSFSQSSGELSHDGVYVATGYAGNGDGKNNPVMQDVVGVGPLPQGKYTIEGPPYHHPHLGPCVMNLTPADDNEMFGRSLFRIHGDSKSDPGNASKGCIVLPRSVREQVWNSEDRYLEVTV